METPDHPVILDLIAFALGRVPVGDFAAWVFASPDLEPVIGPGFARELRELDFGEPGAETALRRLVDRILEHLVDPGPVVMERVRELLCSLVDGTGNVFDVCAELASLHSDGLEWLLPFAALDSDLETVPRPESYPQWDPKSLERKLAEMLPTLEDCTMEAREEAARLLASEFGDAPCAEVSPRNL
jgi:hypothetical protein